jgi:hypothetical protein
MRKGKPATESSEQRADPHSGIANPQIVEAAFRDGTMPLPTTYRRFKTITRLGSRLCRETWRTAPQRMPCARSVILIYLTAEHRAAQGFWARLKLHDVIYEELALGLIIDH